MNHDGSGDTESEAEDGATAPDLERNGQLFELLNAPDRDRCPGARPVVSVSEDDDPAFITEINAHCVSAPTLERRGHFHGNWAELDDSTTFVPRDPLKTLKERWDDARPIVLHDALPMEMTDRTPTAERHALLSEPDGLKVFLEERAQRLGPDFRVLDSSTDLADERDVAKARIGWREDDPSQESGSADDLWVKTQELSTHEDDASIRMRVSFGDEVKDDASRDTLKHRLVSRLAERLMPEVVALHQDPELRGLIGEWMKARPLLTQTIAYWNAPNGGALFHHDAFDEPEVGRQRGVLYAQVTGSTAWLALSQSDLADRVQEFAELLADNSFSHVKELFVAANGAFDVLMRLVNDRPALMKELASPGCGRLAPIVNQGPEFTSLLADAGHAFVLASGDVIVLPNHGYGATCMHSVFCGSPELAFSLSTAIRSGSEGNSTDGGGPRSGGARSRSRGSRRGTRSTRRGRGRPGSKRRSR